MKVMLSLVIGSCLLATGLTGFAQDYVWVGGSSGNVNSATNWDPQKVPYDEKGLAVAVFTNSVAIDNDIVYWYLSGLRVTNGATVVVQGISGKNNRIQCSSGCEGFIVDVASGCSLSHVVGAAKEPASFYALQKPLIKQGGGTFKPGKRFGWSLDNPLSGLEVREGTVDASESEIRCTGEIKICSGATLRSGSYGILAMNGETLAFPACVNVEKGGTFDCGNANQTLLGLEGDGEVVNGNEVTLTMYHSGKRFGGTIRAATLTVANGDYTIAGANWTVGAADTLKDVGTWRFLNEVSVPMEVRFAAGIGTFLVGASYPTDRVFYDLDRIPVQLAYCHAVWYVDDDNYGKQGMDGTTPGKAFGTLEEAMGNPALAEYDTVLALPGTYGEGGGVSGSESTMNRVIVPSNVRLASTEGPERTVIVGQGSTAAGSNAGNGPGAVRCVRLSSGASISGFTLTDGHVAETSDGSKVDFCGGGVFCPGREYVINCIITNNAAARGGAGRNGTFVCCRVFDNRATSNNGSAFFGMTDLYGCVVDRNPCGTKGAYYSTESGNVIANCTFGPNESCDIRAQANVAVCNSLFMSGFNSASVGAFSNCVFVCQPADGMQLNGCVVKSDLTTVAEKMSYAGLDKDLRPLGGSRLIDAGKNGYFNRTSSELLQGYGVVDACGAPRISNGTIDVGGYEYDWRVDYAKCLGAVREIVVDSASAGVVTNAAGGVSLGDRDVVRVRCVKMPGEYSVAVQVVGEGTLTAGFGTGDVRTVTAADGLTELKFSTETVPYDLRFEFVGSGLARLVGFNCPKKGLLLLFR